MCKSGIILVTAKIIVISAGQTYCLIEWEDKSLSSLSSSRIHGDWSLGETAKIKTSQGVFQGLIVEIGMCKPHIISYNTQQANGNSYMYTYMYTGTELEMSRRLSVLTGEMESEVKSESDVKKSDAMESESDVVESHVKKISKKKKRCKGIRSPPT